MMDKAERDKAMSHFLNHYDRDYFKQTVQRLVKEKHMTQKQLAKLVQISPGTFTRYYNGSLRPSLSVVIRISYVLQVPVVSLYDPTYKGNDTEEETDENGLVEDSVKDKVKEQLEQFEPLLKYLQSIGMIVSADIYGNFSVYLSNDKQQESACDIDFLFAEKIKAVVTNAVIDQIYHDDWSH